MLVLPCLVSSPWKPELRSEPPCAVAVATSLPLYGALLRMPPLLGKEAGEALCRCCERMPDRAIQGGGGVSASCPADGAADGVCGQNGARPRHASNELLCERWRAVSVCNVSTFSSSAYGRLVVTLACAALFSRRGDVARQVRLEALSSSGGRDGQCGTRQRRRQPPKV